MDEQTENSIAPVTHSIAVSNGILRHCKAIGIALWVFLWLIDRTTKEVVGADAQKEGLVYSGRPISAREIARDLDVPTRTIHLHLAQLEEKGYIRKIPYGNGAPSGYCVLKSKKWTKPRTSQDSAHPRKKTVGSDREEICAPSQDSAGGSQDSAGGSQDSALPSQKNCMGAKNIALSIEDSTKQHTDNTQTKSKAPADFVLPEWVPAEPWKHFLDMRRRMRKAPTEHAKQLLVDELARLAASGQDPGEVLDQSTKRGYTGVFEVKRNGGTNGNGRAFNRAEEAVDSAIAGGRAALASLGFNCSPLDEVGDHDGRTNGFGRGPVTVDGRGARRLADGQR